MGYRDGAIRGSTNSPYGYTRFLDKAGWAWEFLRRNPEFRRLAKTRKQKMSVHSIADNLRWICCDACERWLDSFGLLFFDEPDHSALEASIFWHPQTYPAIVRSSVRRPPFINLHDRFRLPHAKCDVTILKMPDSIEHVRIRHGTQSLQLLCHGLTLLTHEDHLLCYEIEGLRHINAQTHTLQRFYALYVKQHLPRRLYEILTRTERLTFILRALDVHLQDATYREIAEILFGIKRVKEDWSNPNNCLRDQTRRAVRMGEDLMQGGYKKFLMK